LCFLGVHVERLMATLQHFDGHNKGLFDAIERSMRNPFIAARSAICKLLRAGRAGVIGIIFDYYDEVAHHFISMRVRAMGLSFNAQIFWRFIDYTDWPRTLVEMVRVTSSQEEQLIEPIALYKARDCCMTAGVRKMRKCFSSAEDMYADKDFRRLLSTFAYAYTFTNMCSERNLAQIRQAYGHDDSADSERICASGLLAQVLTEHTRLGGNDPRGWTRQQLVERGVPLRCTHNKKRKACSQSGTFVHWMEREEAQRRHQNLRLTKAEYLAWQKSKAAEFRELKVEEKEMQLQQCRSAHADKVVEAAEVICRPTDLVRPLIGTFVSKHGDRDAPYPTPAFERACWQSMGLPVADKFVGFTRYEESLRQKFLKHIFTKDDVAIRPNEKFSYHMPCAQAHPELCAEDDRWIMPSLIKCGKSLLKELGRLADGKFHCLRFEGDDEESRYFSFFTVGYHRGSNPKVAVLLPCVYVEATNLVEVDGSFDDGDIYDFEYLIHWTLLGRYFRQAIEFPIREVYYAPLQLDKDRPVPDACSAAHLANDWATYAAQSEKLIFPNTSVKARVGKREKAMEKGFRGLFERPRRGREEDEFKMKLPKVSVDGAVPDDDSDASSDISRAATDVADSSSSSSASEPGGGADDVGGGPELLPAVGAVGLDDGVDGGDDLRAGREFQMERWSIWTISRIKLRGTFVGWGGNCYCHTDAGNTTACKRAITAERFTSDEKRCLIKKWLLMGRGIDTTNPNCRKMHLLDIRTAMIPLVDEATLDAEGRALVDASAG
jgi:hypothetical protein